MGKVLDETVQGFRGAPITTPNATQDQRDWTHLVPSSSILERNQSSVPMTPPTVALAPCPRSQTRLRMESLLVDETDSADATGWPEDLG